MREFRVEANVGRPQVAYRETITVPVKVEGRHVRQSGGKGQYGHAVVEFAPQERGAGYEFVDGTVGGSIPREYIHRSMPVSRNRWKPAVRLASRLWTSRRRVVDGSYHDVDSSEMAFKIAGSLALKDGIQTGAAGHSRADHVRSKSPRRKISWATSSAT